MTELERETARGYVKANALNLNGIEGTVDFVEKAEDLKEVLKW